ERHRNREPDVYRGRRQKGFGAEVPLTPEVGAMVRLLVLAATVVALDSQVAPMFVPLGDFNGGDFLGVATGVSDDGSDVVGYGQNGNDYFSYEAFRWTSTDGIGARCRPGRRLRQRRDERLRRRLDRGRLRQRLGNPRLSMDEQRRDAEARGRGRDGGFPGRRGG